jgi:hypothetical protein
MSYVSKRADAFTELLARLARIRTANGFETDAGQLVFFCEDRVLSEVDGAALHLKADGDQPSWSGERAIVSVPVMIEANVRADLDEPWVALEAAIADIKRAIENDLDGNRDHSLSGKASKNSLQRGTTVGVNREPGSTHIAAQVSYTFQLGESWGAP